MAPNRWSTWIGVCLCLFLPALLLSACAPDPQATLDAAIPVPTPTPSPTAIGSLSLCADSYLLAVAPERVGALSWQAGSTLSTAPDVLLDRPRLWNSREVIAGTSIPLLLGPGDRVPDRSNIVALQWGEDFETVAINLDRMAEGFGLDVSGLKDAIESLSALPRPVDPPRILYLSRSGGSAGPGTFVDAVIRAAGGLNANSTPGWHTPPTEHVLQMNPDLVLTSFFGSDYRSANDRAVRHAALRRFLSDRPRVEIEGKLWPCAGPGLIDATWQLNAAILAP